MDWFMVFGALIEESRSLSCDENGKKPFPLKTSKHHAIII
jgi:hypothetical protein